MSVQNLPRLAGRLREDVARIYEASFAASERAAWADRADRGSWFVAAREGRAVGFALVRSLSCPGVYLLEYMAVAEKAQSQGIGGLLFRQAMGLLAHSPGARGVLIEVEPDDGDAGQARRRIAFYLRHGAQRVPAADGYCMPDQVAAGRGVPMRLMWFSLAGEMISPAALRACVVSIYADVYGRAPDDPLLRSILDTMPDEV